MQGIYAIVNTTNGRRYIGSSIDVQRRWRQHVRDLERGVHINMHLQRAWKRYGADAFSFNPIEEVLESSAVIVREQRYIDANVGGYNMGAAGRAMLGRQHSDATRAKQSAAAKRRQPPSQDVRDRIAASLRGRTASPETRAKLAVVRKGQGLGNRVSDETKAKLRACNLGKRPSAETLAKRSAALTGIPRSEEWRANVRASVTAAWQRRRVADGQLSI